MRNRCLNPNNDTWDRYGGRGITIDPTWADYQVFLKDTGERPAGKSIDRRDNDKGYSKANCTWSTPTEQCNNRSSSRFITWGGETLTIRQWARKLCLPNTTLINRLTTLGWSADQAFTTPRQTKWRRDALQDTRQEDQ